jgi:hypothetical protein
MVTKLENYFLEKRKIIAVIFNKMSRNNLCVFWAKINKHLQDEKLLLPPSLPLSSDPPILKIVLPFRKHGKL